jgi:DNA polymerase-3 subunit beta
VSGEFERQEVILPRKTVHELGKLLGDVDDPVTLELLASQVRFRFGNVELTSKVVDGKFPDYNRVIPTGHSKMLVLERPQLLATLQRAAILSNEKFRGVRVVLAPQTLKIICTNTEQEEAEEELEVAYRGDPLDIGFNVTYLLDVLQNLGSEQVQLAFGDANSSALVTVPERSDFKYVVMPMRI